MEVETFTALTQGNLKNVVPIKSTITCHPEPLFGEGSLPLPKSRAGMGRDSSLAALAQRIMELTVRMNHIGNIRLPGVVVMLAQPAVITSIGGDAVKPKFILCGI
jgi:hypothetical protein